MDQTVLENKIKEMMDSQEFAAKVEEAKSPNEVVSIFAEYEVEISSEEAQGYLSLLNKSDNNGDLSEDALEEVSGGAIAEAIAGGFVKVVLKRGLRCNRHTNWGRNGKKCICGMHWTML